jgi:hypothetical protein
VVLGRGYDHGSGGLRGPLVSAECSEASGQMTTAQQKLQNFIAN